MGASKSKATVLNEVMNSASIDVLNRNSNAATGVINQSNSFALVGDTGGQYSNISQLNVSRVNVASLQTAVQSGSLQSDLSATMTNAIKQQAAALGYSANESEVKSVVSSTISSKITNESFQSIKAEVAQSNVIQLVGNSKTVLQSLVQKNEAELIMKLVSDTNSSIIAKLQTTGAISTDLSQSTAPLFSSSGLILMAIIIIAVIAIFSGNMTTVIGYVATFIKTYQTLIIGGLTVAAITTSILVSSSPKASNFYGGCPCAAN
jgi:hypothetical protein